jgi:hypothetical protein
MAKQVYYLQGERLPKVQTSFPLITWIYRWRDSNGQSKFRASTAFWELKERYYFEN